MNESHFVEIISRESGCVEKRIGPYGSHSAADRAENGILINLNHDDFYTIIVHEGMKKPEDA